MTQFSIVLEALEQGPATAADIEAITGIRRSNVNTYLLRLTDMGLATRKLSDHPYINRPVHLYTATNPAEQPAATIKQTQQPKRNSAEWVDVFQAAEMTGYSAPGLRNMTQERYSHYNFPKPIKQARKFWWRRSEIEQWIEDYPPKRREQIGRERMIEARRKRPDSNAFLSAYDAKIESFNNHALSFLRGDYDAAWQRQRWAKTANNSAIAG